MAFYVIRAGDQYFSSGGGWVNTSGLCDTATWVGDPDKAWCTSSIEHAEAVANYNGGWPESLDEVKGNPQAENQSRNLQEDDKVTNGTTEQRRRAVRVKRRTTPPSGNYTPKPLTDDYSDRQEAIHKGTAKAAAYLHLAGGAFLGAVQTFFRRTFLSFVAAFALLGGMILAGIGYAISLGFMPQELFPDGQSIGDLYQGLVQWFATAQPWQLWGCAIAIALAVMVQSYQSWSIYTIAAGRRQAKSGGKAIFSTMIHRFLFWAVSSLIWYLDFQAISGVSFAAGIAGVALWLWAAFPSEIAAMILQIQKSAVEE